MIRNTAKVWKHVSHRCRNNHLPFSLDNAMHAKLEQVIVCQHREHALGAKQNLREFQWHPKSFWHDHFESGRLGSVHNPPHLGTPKVSVIPSLSSCFENNVFLSSRWMLFVNAYTPWGVPWQEDFHWPRMHPRNARVLRWTRWIWYQLAMICLEDSNASAQASCPEKPGSPQFVCPRFGRMSQWPRHNTDHHAVKKPVNAQFTFSTNAIRN